MTAKRMLVLFFIFCTAFSSISPAETFFGETKTGLIEVEGFRNPVFMYVPDTLKPGQKYPLVISIPDFSQTADENIKEWTTVADRMSLIILSPTYKFLDGLPNQFDRWFFELKHLMVSVYPVNPEKIFLVGSKEGAQYAGYLGTNYPEEFSGVVLVEGSWSGKFEKLLRLQNRPAKQRPFYVALREGQTEIIHNAEQKAYQFESKGYFVEIKQYSEAEDFTKVAFKKELIQWLSSRSEDWSGLINQNQKSWKEKFRRGVKDFFTV